MRHGISLLLGLALTTTFAAAQDPLGLEDVKRIVTQLETVVPRNPEYVYPIDISIKDDPEVNASAGIYWYGTREDKATAKKYTQLTVYQGLLDAPGLDEVRLRGVLAHEMAHIALGHAMLETAEVDTMHALTRQQELEADARGAEYLEALGYDRAEMVETILWLGNKDMAWIHQVAGDHASPMMRAAMLDPTDDQLAALADYEHGLMYLECGQYRAALPFFDQAIAKQPGLIEAYVMAGRTALQYYYERLPLKVQEAWLRPNFGPMLTDTHLLSGRSTTVLDEDRERWRDAMARIEAIPAGGHGSLGLFLAATGKVLHPDGDPEVIQQGGDMLGTLYMLPPLDLENLELIRYRQRCANNHAIALQRLGKPAEARALLLREMESMQLQVPPMANNIGALPINGMDADQMKLAAQFLEFYLTRVPPSSAGYERAAGTFQALLERLGIPKIDLISPEVVYCSAVEARIGGKEVGLFDPAKNLDELFGEPKVASRPVEQYPDMAKLAWGDNGEVLALVERGRIVRLSSKRPGDSILLRSVYEEMPGQVEVRVGMTEAELLAVLDPRQDGGVYAEHVFLASRNFFEIWTYYPKLNFGVLFMDGVVAGVTVTPIKPPQ